MKIALITSIFNLAVGCGSSNKSIITEDSSKTKTTLAMSSDILNGFDSSKSNLSDKAITIIVSFAAIECGCPQWFETKFKDVKFLRRVERFYLEPANKKLINANGLWDGEHLPLTLRITGRFSKEKEIPRTYSVKGELEKARIFWYDAITILSSLSK